jgi:hypothetical protein
LVLAALAALLPPTAWDGFTYHLVSAHADAATGRIVLDSANPDLYQPQVTEMLYALLLLVRGGNDGVAAPLHLACGVLAVALIALLGWRAAGPRGGVRAGALAVAIPTVVILAGWPYVDLNLAAAELGALVALPHWQAARRAGDVRAARGWLVAAGLAAGVALDVKFTAAFALIALAALVAVAAWREWPPHAYSPARSAWRVAGARAAGALGPAALLVTVGLVAGGAWALRNLVVTGDPVYPYHIGTLFPPGPSWDAQRTVFVDGPGWGASALWRVPLLPLETTLLGRQGTAEFDATLGPLLLLLLPLGLLTLRVWPQQRFDAARDGQLAAPPAPGSGFWRWPLAFAGVLWLLWGVELAGTGVAMQARLFLALYLALAVPAAVAWIRLGALRVPAVSLERLVGVAVVLCFALTLGGQAVQTLQLDNLAALVGAQSRDDYLAEQLGPYYAAMRRLDALGPSAHVLLFYEPRSYLIRARVAPDVFLDNFNVLYRHCRTAVAIARCARAEGFTHALVYQQGVRLLRALPDGKDTPAEFVTFDAVLAGWTPVYRDNVPLVGRGPPGTGWYVLYALGGAQ